jgi:hypothetical protein
VEEILSTIEFSVKIINITKSSPHPTTVALAPPSVSWFWLGSVTGWMFSLKVNGVATCEDCFIEIHQCFDV